MLGEGRRVDLVSVESGRVELRILGEVAESRCPSDFVGNYCILPIVIGDSGVVPGGWRWHAELHGDLRPRHARREGLGHRPGEAILGQSLPETAA